MDKLIELLNKAQNSGDGLFGHWIGNFERKYYAKNHWTLGYTDEYYETYDYSDRDICGKDGGFIKRLVDNDKIDLKNKTIIAFSNELCKQSDYKDVLMLLAIQDEPIQFLVSILK